ncbi:MAG: pyridoxamine 5'-phosphate oxidase family protein [Geminicoccaceae bacterium]|nr:pyridoxamine 5'-phosphate oxidase family protein [Geminicoccaceae bacterium]
MTDPHETPGEARKKVIDLIEDVGFAMLATHAPGGAMHARPMVAKRGSSEGELWFFTYADSRKVREIRSEPRILLTYAEPKGQDYVSLNGTAEVVQDAGKVKELWREPLRTWFPKGPEDPEIALLKVEIVDAEYWDSPSSAMVYAYGYAKARLTGEPPKPGDVGKVGF